MQFQNVSGGASPTITATGAPVIMPPPTRICDATSAGCSVGTFNLSLVANGSITPASTQYIFIICSPAGPSIQPDPILSAGGCFSTGPITISGATQSITSNINTVPPIGLAAGGIIWSGSSGGTGLVQVASQSILTNGTGIAPGTSQAQTPITINGLTANSMCNASPPTPLPPSWQGIVIPFVGVAANTATVFLTNSSTSLASPIGYQVNVKCIL